LIPPAERFLIVRQGGGILARRLGDACQKCRLIGIICSESRHRDAEIILRGRCEAVPSVAQVDETGVTREEFFFSSAFGAVALPHLSLNPRGETHFLHFQQDSVGARDTDEEGEKVREKTLVLKGIAIFRARKLLQKVTPHKLLSNRRAALGEDRRALRGIIAV